jgi:hypothetical protein
MRSALLVEPCVFQREAQTSKLECPSKTIQYLSAGTLLRVRNGAGGDDDLEPRI